MERRATARPAITAGRFQRRKIASGESDTSRFLVAGAARALWVRTEQGRLAEAMPALRKRLESAHNVIVESNSVLKFMRPDLYLTVLDPGTEDFKNSAREFLDRAGAVILHDGSETGAAWQQCFVEAGGGAAGVSDYASALRDGGDCGVCAEFVG